MNARKPLRVWPGVVAVTLQWLARFGIKAVVPGFKGFAWSGQGTILGAAAVLLWWMFFSRAAWVERLGALVLMIGAMSAAWALRHESMGPFWVIAYALPVLCLGLVAGVVVSRRFADGPRRATIAAAIAVACGVWTLVRTEGISGDHVATFAWRWTQTPEQKVLVARDAPAWPPRAVTASRIAETPVTTGRGSIGAEWPGFRGRQRDGITSGARVAINWSASPPVELWRRPVGPGWSSFAVRGNLLYTQEQRGDDEVVACYDANTGQPVWTHRDAARFFESNGGAGPRATPTLSGGRVYTFGATGILNALNAADGSVAWSRNVTSGNGPEIPYWGFSSSPVVIDDVVVVAAAGQLLAFGLANGAPRWSGPVAEGYSSPHLAIIHGVPQILLMSTAGTISVAPADGKVLWKHPWGGSAIVQPAVTPDGGVLVVAGAGSGTRRLAVNHGAGGWTADERWTSIGLKPYFNDFVVHKGHVFGFDASILASIDLETGQRNWKGGRYGNGQLVLLPEQDLLLVLSEDGELALVKAAPDRFTEVAKIPAIEGKTWNHPVVVGDTVFVRNGQEMAAFRMPREER